MAEDGKFRIEKFDSTDFSWWKMKIEDLLVQKDLDVVLGDKPEKMSDADWDQKAMSVIRLLLTKNVAFNILKEKTAKGIMEALFNTYEKPFVANRVFLIRELVNTRMKEGTSVTKHINIMNSILTRLASVKIKFDDEVQALLLLSSLPDSWNQCPNDKKVNITEGSASDEEVLLTCFAESSVDSWVMDSGASSHAIHSGETLQNLVIGDFGKVRLAYDRALELNEHRHEVKFRDGQWKVAKGNLVMARGRKSGSLYMVELPSEGVTVSVQRRNKVRFTKSRGQNKVFYAREKPRATGQTHDERARKGSRRPVRGIYGSGSSRCASAKLPRREWVRRINIPAVRTSLENFLLSTESVCSQDVPRSGSVHLQVAATGELRKITRYTCNRGGWQLMTIKPPSGRMWGLWRLGLDL
ncbi:unnamed protein product [Cuscuta campestris]|uniref:Retrovirus-related Pol polyprotein from transposon TNT 1-94 n=1 Tax=Cuscuta campestris TaxID=132261 RepID=A0A484NGW9_9ASTE|nr:unnamed protein product [Cuscuta campestris]